MLRSLLVLLAVLVPGLAFLFGRPWLYVLTGAILVILLGLVGWWFWTTYATEEPDRPRPRPDPEESDDSLEELGIVDIKPESAEEDPPKGHSAQEKRTDPPPVESTREASPPSASSASGPALATQDPSADSGEPEATPTETSSEQGPSESHTDPVLGPLLESARAALDARTVCLLVQEEVALTYRIEAAASTDPSVRHTGTFDTQAPLLTATMSRESVTVRTLAEEEVAVEDLRYYEDPSTVDHLALAPVSQPDASSTTFLLADADDTSDLGTSRARTLLKHFSETVALFLDTGQHPTEQSAAEPTDEPPSEPDSDESTAADSTGGEIDDPRPRREIIAEEMEAAQSDSEDLALALVLLNRSESIARRGEEAVTSTERLFRARLEQLVPGSRIEPFGELTYGIFFREGADAVESQVADLKSSMAQEKGELEGGVSVGVAVWHDEDPEALRAEATEALREAYETGTPTIVT